VLLSIGKSSPQMGCLAFPFIDQGKDLGYTRERMKKEKKQRREPWGCAVLLCRWVLLVIQSTMKVCTHHNLVRHQCYRQALPSWSWCPCPSLALQAGAVARRLVSPRHVVCSIDPRVWSHTGIDSTVLLRPTLLET
jgi:hypothetical protein